MTNVQWRRMHGIARILIKEMRESELPEDISNELDRISKLVDNPDYIKSTPLIHKEAPELDLAALQSETREKYLTILNEASRFK